jgi:hypothetical protein
VLVPLFFHRANAFIPLGVAALGAGLYTLFHPGLRKGVGDDADEALDEAPDYRPRGLKAGSERAQLPH